MKFKSLYLKNYIGIFNGLGRTEILIDFTKCKYNKVIIRGANGSGKSTILGALSPLQDDNNSIIPGKEGQKIVEFYQDGIIYRIMYIHPVKSDGDRATVKGYFYKNDMCLTPTGNVSDCKEMIYNTFGLDANFLALSQLTSENRGLIDKKPSERKAFVNSIINNLEVYNNIYKTLTKKSSIFKSMINTLTKNIDSLGDEDALRITRDTIQNQINQLGIQKDNNQREITLAESEINRLDPTGNIQNTYNTVKESIKDISSQIKPIRSRIDKTLDILNIADESSVLDSYNIDKKMKIEMESKSAELQTRINESMSNRNVELEQLNAKIAKLNSLNSEIEHKNVDALIKETKEKIDDIEYLFSGIGINNLNILTKDEYILGINTLSTIKDQVDMLKSSYSIDTISKAQTVDINYLTGMISLLEKEKANELNILNELLVKRNTADALIKTMKALEQRPDACTINSCSFISSALEAKKELDKLGNIELEIENITDKINKKSNELDDLYMTHGCYIALHSIYNLIDGSNIILNKLPNGKMFSDRELFTKKLISNSAFEDVYLVLQFLDLANNIEQYHFYKKNLDTLNNERLVNGSKIDLINQIQLDIIDLNNKINKISNDIGSWRNQKVLADKTVSDINDRASKFEILLSQIEEFNNLNLELHSQHSRLDQCEKEMIEISQLINKISLLTQENLKIVNTVSNLVSRLDSIKHSLSSLEDYKNDRDVYITKYNKVEKIKYYSSPRTGISTIFIDIYMSKILNMANVLLSNLFEGEFQLMPFVINETEFKIPCLGSGIQNDDVSSMSTGQICMISMIVSFSILYQSSTKYNILRLDEIDGGLDTSNRLYFLQVLDELIFKLGCEQVIMISHNNEINHSACDIIQLKTHSGDEISDGNIIFNITGGK